MKKKVKCPHCGDVFEIDTEEYVKDREIIVSRKLVKTEPVVPKVVFVTCKKCQKQFKIKL